MWPCVLRRSVSSIVKRTTPCTCAHQLQYLMSYPWEEADDMTNLATLKKDLALAKQEMEAKHEDAFALPCQQRST
eukprot:491128-Amphidinium_carterae.1